VHGLVNNAGGQFPAPLMAISKKGFDAVVANNLTGGFLMMRELFNQCMQAHGGAMVNMTADFRNGMPGMGHSGAARAGMSNLTMTAPPSNGRSRRARQRRGAGLDRLSSGMDTYGGAMRHDPKLKATCRCAAWAPRPRSAPPSSSCCRRRGLHHRRHAADRRRGSLGSASVPLGPMQRRCPSTASTAPTPDVLK
jgi:hypothetical protein